MRITLGVYLLAIVFSANPVFAQDVEQSAEEVFWTELVYPQEQGELQLSLSPWINTASNPNIGQSPVTVEYGISDNWQLEAEWSGPTYSNSSESALELGTKYSFLDLFNGGFHLAVGNEFELPFSGEGVATEPFIIAAIDLPMLANMHVFSQMTLELELSDEEDSIGEESTRWGLHIGAILPTKRVFFSAEFGWMQEDEGLHSYATPGIIWEVVDDLQLGVGIPIGINERSDSFRISTFVTYEFELFESD